jgi:hypothetical protein
MYRRPPAGDRWPSCRPFGLRSFSLSGEAEFDQLGDGFRSRGQVGLLPTPIVDLSKELIGNPHLKLLVMLKGHETYLQHVLTW